jgi:hypothetical protein
VIERELRTLILAYRPALLAEQSLSVLRTATLIGRTAGTERFPTGAHFARQAGSRLYPCPPGAPIVIACTPAATDISTERCT